MGKKIVLVKPRGFCMGVNRANVILERLLSKSIEPYCYHEIVHNTMVVDDFTKKGVRFIDSLDEIPSSDTNQNKKTLVISAHGTSPKVKQLAKEKNLDVVDATCPFVVNSHKNCEKYAREGAFIILIGDINHVEIKGLIDEIEENKAQDNQFTVIKSAEEVDSIETDLENIVVISQTTLLADNVVAIKKAIEEKFGSRVIAIENDTVCFATQARQNAVEQVAKDVDMFIVVGSKHSSNSNKLRLTAEKYCEKSFLVDSPEDLPSKNDLENVEKIGLISGASVPEKQTSLVLDALKSIGFSDTEEKDFTGGN